MATTYNNLYLDARQRLRQAGIEGAQLEARELVCCAAGKSREQFYRDMALYASGQVEEKLAQLEQDGKLRAVITQNIDGLHQKAGAGKPFRLLDPLGAVKTVIPLPGFEHPVQRQRVEGKAAVKFQRDLQILRRVFHQHHETGRLGGVGRHRRWQGEKDKEGK